MFGKKCPRCGGKNINTIKESFKDRFFRNLLNAMMPIRLFLGYAHGPKTQYVCKDDGLIWSKA